MQLLSCFLFSTLCVALAVAKQAKLSSDETRSLRWYDHPTEPPCVELDPVHERTLSGIKITGDSALEPDVSIPFALGIAKVDLGYQPFCDGSTSRFFVCMSATFAGITPYDLTINKAAIDDTGDTEVIFSYNIDDDDFLFEQCDDVFEDVWLDIIRNPDQFYIRAAPDYTHEHIIRGQLLQSFVDVELDNSQVVDPFHIIDEGEGNANIFFRNRGEEVCFDVTVTGFDPDVGYLNRGAPGESGITVLNFSPTKIDPGRFLGCMTIDELGVGVSAISEILADGYLYYFSMHLAGQGQGPSFYTNIRGQIPNPDF